MRALITGVAGFVGGHLAEAIQAETDWQVWGTILDEADRAFVVANVNAAPTDLRNPTAVREVIEQVRPDVVFHLAGRNHACSPALLHSLNTGGTACVVAGAAVILTSRR